MNEVGAIADAGGGVVWPDMSLEHLPADAQWKTERVCEPDPARSNRKPILNRVSQNITEPRQGVKSRGYAVGLRAGTWKFRSSNFRDPLDRWEWEARCRSNRSRSHAENGTCDDVAH